MNPVLPQRSPPHTPFNTEKCPRLESWQQLTDRLRWPLPCAGTANIAAGINGCSNPLSPLPDMSVMANKGKSWGKFKHKPRCFSPSASCERSVLLGGDFYCFLWRCCLWSRPQSNDPWTPSTLWWSSVIIKAAQTAHLFKQTCHCWCYVCFWSCEPVSDIMKIQLIL